MANPSAAEPSSAFSGRLGHPDEMRQRALQAVAALGETDAQNAFRQFPARADADDVAVQAGRFATVAVHTFHR